MAKYPKWSTPERQEYLVKLWLEYGNKCLQGHNACPIPEHYSYTSSKAVTIAIPVICPSGLPTFGHKTVSIPITQTARLYDYVIEQVINDWKEQDRQLRKAEAEAEARELHRITTRNKPFFQFNADNFYSNQPIYYYEGLGISGITLKPFAKVRIASSYACLFIELDSQTFKCLSKNRKRKAIRYKKPLPSKVDSLIHYKVYQAVRDYLK